MVSRLLVGEGPRSSHEPPSVAVVLAKLFQRHSQPKGLFAYPTTAGEGLDLWGVPLAILDVETTGLSAGQDRIVEIAVVRVGRDGGIEDEWASLLDPGRDVGPTFIHHITNEMVAGAPSFRDVVGDILARLDGAIVVGHNASFDEGFLQTELGLLGIKTPPVPALCTLGLARSLLSAPNYRLASCCSAVGVTHDGAHTALGDARMTAKLAACLLRDREMRLWWPNGPATLPRYQALAKPRTRASHLKKGTNGWMANLMARLPITTNDAEPEEADAYLATLSSALEDGKLTGPEAKVLARQAGRAGLGAAQLDDLHRRFLHAMRAAALTDDKLTPIELRQLTKTADLLGLPGYFQGLQATTSEVPARKPAEAKRRLRVWCAPGLPPEVPGHVTAAGYELASNLTASVYAVVCIDPTAADPKIDRARSLGIRIIAAPDLGALAVSASDKPFAAVVVRPPHPVPLPEGPAPASPGTASAWLPDPTSRGELRWWDGSSWTENIAISGRIWSSTPWLATPADAQPGLVDGQPVHTHAQTLDELQHAGRFRDALVLSYRCVDATENEASLSGLGVAPRYYEAAAAAHQARGEHAAEVLLLRRFARQRHAAGVSPQLLLKRLETLELPL